MCDYRYWREWLHAGACVCFPCVMRHWPVAQGGLQQLEPIDFIGSGDLGLDAAVWDSDGVETDGKAVMLAAAMLPSNTPSTNALAAEIGR